MANQEGDFLEKEASCELDHKEETKGLQILGPPLACGSGKEFVCSFTSESTHLCASTGGLEQGPAQTPRATWSKSGTLLDHCSLICKTQESGQAEVLHFSYEA